MSNATQRTLAALRTQGYICGMVERFVRDGQFGHRVDLFGIIDLIALDKNPNTGGVIGIQSCTTAYTAHVRTITEDCKQNTIDWLETPNCRLELWAWRKIKKKRGGKLKIWKPRIADIYLQRGKLVVVERET